jgi:hypothetical protein
VRDRQADQTCTTSQFFCAVEHSLSQEKGVYYLLKYALKEGNTNVYNTGIKKQEKGAML